MTSNLKTLMKLPDVFDVDTLESIKGTTRHAVRMMLARAHRDGDVMPAGPRSGIYYNLLRNPKPCIEAAVKIGIPSAIIIGPSALHWHSATSQRSHLLTVSWLKNRKNVYQKTIDNTVAVSRPIEWYRAIAGHTSDGAGGLAVLDAAFAVADMQLYGGPGDIPVLDDDDLDLDDADISEDDVDAATEIFRLHGIGEQAAMNIS